MIQRLSKVAWCVALLTASVGIAVDANASQETKPSAASTVPANTAAEADARGALPECADVGRILSMPPLGYVQSAVGRAFQPRIDPETKESKIPQLEREPRLIFTIDEQGNPIDVGIQRSSRDRNVDRALLDLGRRMKFTAMSGCGPRRGVVPIGIAP